MRVKKSVKIIGGFSLVFWFIYVVINLFQVSVNYGDLIENIVTPNVKVISDFSSGEWNEFSNISTFKCPDGTNIVKPPAGHNLESEFSPFHKKRIFDAVARFKPFRLLINWLTRQDRCLHFSIVNSDSRFCGLHIEFNGTENILQGLYFNFRVAGDTTFWYTGIYDGFCHIFDEWQRPLCNAGSLWDNMNHKEREKHKSSNFFYSVYIPRHCFIPPKGTKKINFMYITELVIYLEESAFRNTKYDFWLNELGFVKQL